MPSPHAWIFVPCGPAHGRETPRARVSGGDENASRQQKLEVLAPGAARCFKGAGRWYDRGSSPPTVVGQEADGAFEGGADRAQGR